MKKIKLLKPACYRAAGSILTVKDSEAELLINLAFAEEVKEEEEQKKTPKTRNKKAAKDGE